VAENTPGSLRIGDVEREQAISQLQEHTAAGRLDLDEFEERMGHVTAARTAADLDAVMADLPRSPQPLPPKPPVPAQVRDMWGRRRALPSWISLSLLMVAIWAMAGFGYFWPAWVIVPTALGALGESGHRRHRQEPPDEITA
jgi:hypothetical protein